MAFASTRGGGNLSRQRTNGLAVASLVLGIVWLSGLGSVLALVFGYVGKRQIDEGRGNETGRGLAVAGIVLGWIGLLGSVLIVALLVITSHQIDRALGESPTTSAAPIAQPSIGAHWYEAMSFDVCGELQANLPGSPPNPNGELPGIRTDGDGVIQVVPMTDADVGDNATLARFVQDYPGLMLTPNTLRIPGANEYRNGQRCPSGSPDAGMKAQVVIKMWPSFAEPGSDNPIVISDPNALKLGDGQLITVAFVPPGTTIPKPASIVALLNDRAGRPTSTNPSGS